MNPRLGVARRPNPPRIPSSGTPAPPLFTFASMATYRIVRMYMHGGSRAVSGLSGLTLDEARAHCSNPETSSRTATSAAAKHRTRQRGPWFDAYTEEA